MSVGAVFLVGFMGSGKNTVGQALAHQLGWDFIDLDARIESRERRNIPEIFRTDGETAFRQAETRALQDLLEGLNRNSVVALGGGAFAQPANRGLLLHWPTVFLDAPADELWQRCQQDAVERPLRQSHEQFAELLASRVPSYREATLTINTSGKTLLSICSEVVDALHLGNATASLK